MVDYTQAYYDILLITGNKEGNFFKVQHALNNGADSNSIPSYNDIRKFFTIMLYFGIIDKNIENVIYALKNGADPNSIPSYDDIHEFVNMEKAMIALIFDKMGRVYEIPLLYLAIGFGSSEIARLLINKGADVTYHSPYFGHVYIYAQTKPEKEEFRDIFFGQKRKVSNEMIINSCVNTPVFNKRLLS
jgi:hypothetical protein